MRLSANKEVIKQFAAKVRIRRHLLNLSQEELAERVDCHVNHIGCIERGLTDPSLSMIMRIARALEIDPKHLIPETT